MIRGTEWRQQIRDTLSRSEREVVVREGFRPSAVLIPIYEEAGKYHIVLTRRSEDVVHHKGQVSFPGGAYDEQDGDLKATALREAHEEIGVRPDDVEVLGCLDDRVTLTSYYVITPFVGAIPYPYEFSINQREVVELIQAPVTALLDPACFRPETPDDEGNLQPWGYYHCRSHDITGITALILRQLLALVFR